MALDFPANPTNGQTFGNYIYDTSIPGWRNVNSGEGVGLQFKSGLVPVVPTSVNVGGGSATVSSGGVVTVNAAYNITINGVFSATYKNYLVQINYNVVSGTPSIFMRFSTAGSVSGSGYTYASIRETAGQATVHMGTAGSTNGIYVLETDANQYSGLGTTQVHIFNPFLTQYTTVKAHGSGGYAAQGWNMILASGIHDNTSRDGFNLSHGALSASGTIEIYGYN